MKTDKDQSQGKQSTAKTDATYDRDAEQLKNSATTSQNSGTSPSKMGAGGVMREEEEPKTKNSSGRDAAGKSGSEDQGS